MLLGWHDSQRRVDPHSQRTCVALIYDPIDPHQPGDINPNTGFPGPGIGNAASVTQDAGMTPDGTPCQRGVSIYLIMRKISFKHTFQTWIEVNYRKN